MNRLQFMTELRGRLSQLPPEELNSALLYYAEYFDDAGPENEQKVIQELGTPEQVAAQIIEDYAAKCVRIPPEPVPKQKRSTGSIVLLCILAVFAAPIVLPLAIALAAVAVSVIVAAFAVLVSLFVASGALILSGLFTAGVSFAVLLESPPTTVMFFGIGLLMTGVGLALMLGSFALTKAACKGVAALARLCFHRRRGRHEKNG